MGDKYQVIYADPPWSFQDHLLHSNVKRGASSNYATMLLEDIKKLPIKQIADPNGAILALWVPACILQSGLDVMKAWGFEHKQIYVWVKVKKSPLKDLKSKIKKNLSILEIMKIIEEYSLQNTLAFGMGRLTRACSEICLIGINNKKIYKKLSNKSQRSVCLAQNLKHSAKPDHLHRSLELMFPSEKKIELFSRKERSGWLCLGNEVGNKEDIRESLKKLL